MDTNEGGALVPNNTENSGNKKGKKRGKKTVSRWLDQELVKTRVERREDGKLGVREGGKFRLWRAYSGKTFDELEDLVPLREVTGSVYFELASVFWLVMRRFVGKLGDGRRWRQEDWGILFIMYRMQSANAGSIFTRAMLEYALSHRDIPKGHSITLTNVWVKRMRSKGLIEQVPGLKVYEGRKIAMFRLSATGRQLLFQFLDTFKRVHEDIRYWVKTVQDAEYLSRYVARFTLGVDPNNNLTDDSGNLVTFEEMIELTKADLKAMGHRGTGSKPDYWDDLSD